jgi:ABC-type sugar transport system ATPase subunit
MADVSASVSASDPEPLARPPASPILRATGISKRFGAVVALEDVSLEVRPGEIAGLVGDNGAGKSTLIKIMSAVFSADTGEIEYEGLPATFGSPAQARAAGIETVYQDLALAGNMSVWANIFLGRERLLGPKWLRILDKRGMAIESEAMLARLRMNVPPINAPVASLSGGQRQAIAIARAAAGRSKLIIMDEPTAALGVGETRAVEEVIRELRERGFGLIIISHNLDQIFRLADSIWVLRRGRMIGKRTKVQSSPDEIVSMITGSDTVLGMGASA